MNWPPLLAWWTANRQEGTHLDQFMEDRVGVLRDGDLLRGALEHSTVQQGFQLGTSRSHDGRMLHRAPKMVEGLLR